MIFFELLRKTVSSFLIVWLGENFSWDVQDKTHNNNDAVDSNDENDTFLEEADKLNKVIEWLRAEEKIMKQWYEVLNKKLTIPDRSDPDGKQTVERLQFYKTRFLEAVKNKQEVQQHLQEFQQAVSQSRDSYEFKKWLDRSTDGTQEQKNTFWVDALKTISNREFLKTPVEKRLQYITKNHIDADTVSSWQVTQLEFSFTFDGKFNQDLYLKTTAWQVLPSEVRSVTSSGVNYERRGLNGEFYNKETGRRLIIREDTKVHVDDRVQEYELQRIRDDIRSRWEKYTEGIDRKIAEVALEKGIEPDMFLVCVKNNVDIDKLELWWYDKEDTKRMSELLKNEKYVSLELERYATQISRVLDGEKWADTQWDKYDIQLAAKIMSELNPSDFTQQLKEYWYTQEDIENAWVHQTLEDYSTKMLPFSREQLASVPGAITSNKAERDSSGTTLCSKTARLNLQKLWLYNVPHWSSAKQSFDQYESQDIIPPKDLPPLKDSSIAVLDLYLDASPKNRLYWHRVACVKLGWSWAVLDPYYPIPNIWRTTRPIPFEKYMDFMNQRGQRLWWAKGYEKKA